MIKKIRKSLIAVLLGVILLSIMPVYGQKLDQSTPQAAYRSFLKAQASGDFDLFTTTIVKAHMKNPPSPEERKMFGMMSMMAPKNVKILSQNIAADKATLKVQALIPLCSSVCNGTVTLQKENGVWKVNTESYKVASSKTQGSATCTYKFGL